MPAPLPGIEAHRALHEQSSNRRPDIQGLRAVAVLMVVAFHAGLPVPGGFVGVDVFFVISGFVITAMLHREWQSTGGIRFGRFYLRRFKRLTPALALMVAVTMTIAAFVLSPLGPQQTAAATAIGAMFVVANFVIARTTGGYFDASAELNPLLNTWSLSVEEQFYLLFPAILALGWLLARRHGPRPLRLSPMVIVTGVAVASFGLAMVSSEGLTFRGSGTILGFYSPFTRAWEFAVGALLALALGQRTIQVQRLRTIGGLIGAVMLVASPYFITETTPFPGPWTLLPVLGTLFLLVAGTDRKVISSRVLSSKPLVKIGDWSYSIYLWHWPLIVFAGLQWPQFGAAILIAAAVSFLPAVLSFYYVERPLRTLSDLGKFKTLLLIVLTVAAPVAVAAAVALGAKLFWQPRAETVVAQAVELPAGYALGCHFGPDDGYQDPEPCEWNAAGKGWPIYLLGDSNAAHYTEALIEVASTLDRPLTVSTSSGCPLLDLPRINSSNPGYEDRCPARTERLLQWMENEDPGVVVLSQWDGYWLGDEQNVIDDGVAISEQQAKIELMEASIVRTVERLESAGHEVIYVQTLPNYFGEFSWDPYACTLSAVLLSDCTHSMPLQASQQRSAAVRQAIDRLGAKTRARIIDLSDEVCPGDRCVSQSNGIAIFRDPNHISVSMSRALAPVFTLLISDSKKVKGHTA